MFWRVISSAKILAAAVAYSKRLTRFLPVVVGVIATGVTFCIAVKHPNNFYKVWETASVIFTAGFAVITWRRWFHPKNGIGVFVEPRTIGLTVFCYIGLFIGVVAVIIFIWVNPVRLWSVLNRYWLAFHCAALLLCAVCGCIMDHFAAKAKIRSGMATKARKSTVFQKERDRAFVAFRYADLPTIAAFTLIGMFMAVFAWWHLDTRIELESFLAGAVSFQLITTNVMFEMAKRR